MTEVIKGEDALQNMGLKISPNLIDFRLLLSIDAIKTEGNVNDEAVLLHTIRVSIINC